MIFFFNEFYKRFTNKIPTYSVSIGLPINSSPFIHPKPDYHQCIYPTKFETQQSLCYGKPCKAVRCFKGNGERNKNSEKPHLDVIKFQDRCLNVITLPYRNVYHPFNLLTFLLVLPQYCLVLPKVLPNIAIRVLKKTIILNSLCDHTETSSEISSLNLSRI